MSRRWWIASTWICAAAAGVAVLGAGSGVVEAITAAAIVAAVGSIVLRLARTVA